MKEIGEAMKIKISKYIFTDQLIFLWLSIVMGIVLVGQFYLKWVRKVDISTETIVLSSILLGSCMYFAWNKKKRR